MASDENKQAAAHPCCGDASSDPAPEPFSDATARDADGARVQAAGSCCRHKNTERTEAFQADLQKRLNRAIGQLNGVKGMIDDNRYCGDVLTQLAAAESAIHTVSEMLLRDHLETCVTERVREGDTEVIDEAMKLIKRFAR